MNAPTLVMGFALIANSSAAIAATSCTPLLESAWIRAVPPGSAALAGYVTLRNPCPRAITVAAVVAPDFSMSMLHQTSAGDGMSRMRSTGPVVVPAYGRVRFAPGRMHVMLMRPRRELKVGDSSPVIFRLADGRRLGAKFVLRTEPPR